MLMLILFLAFWEKSIKENIGKLCKIKEFNQNRFLPQVEQTNVKSPAVLT